MRRLPIPIVLAVVLTLVLSTMALAGGPGGQETDVGTSVNPVRLSVDSRPGGLTPEQNRAKTQILADALHDATGLAFSVDFFANALEAVDSMCEELSDSMMRFAGSAEYVFADETCGADTGLWLVGDGVYGYQGEVFVPIYSNLETLDDLDGLDWYYPDKTSLSGYVAASAMLMTTGVNGYTANEAGDHMQAVMVVYNNAVSGNEIPVFATAFKGAMDALEAKAIAGEVSAKYSDVKDQVRALTEYPVIPNNPVVFGPDFPAKLRHQIEKALFHLANPHGPNYEIWEDSIGELTSATDLDKLKKKDFHSLDSLKAALKASGFWWDIVRL
jgi:ABC-type phosphate/phosphonate transport system substrate-binding protein